MLAGSWMNRSHGYECTGPDTVNIYQCSSSIVKTAMRTRGFILEMASSVNYKRKNLSSSQPETFAQAAHE